jgi:hypothetical protein
MHGIFLVAGDLVASQEGLCFLELRSSIRVAMQTVVRRKPDTHQRGSAVCPKSFCRGATRVEGRATGDRAKALIAVAGRSVTDVKGA